MVDEQWLCFHDCSARRCAVIGLAYRCGGMCVYILSFLYIHNIYIYKTKYTVHELTYLIICQPVSLMIIRANVTSSHSNDDVFVHTYIHTHQYIWLFNAQISENSII
jgi:hypothetical protein